MKRNKIRVIKIIGIILISLLLIISLNNQVFADPAYVDKNPASNPEYYRPNSTNDASDAGKLQTIGNDIVGVIQVIGTVLSVVVLVVIGIKYMIGSVEERAEYKRTMLPYIIGAVLVFGITNILGIIVGLADLLPQ